jgi:hypothetical protein
MSDMHVMHLGKAKKSVEKFLKKRGVPDVEKMTLAEKEALFIEGRKMYEDGFFSLDELSELCEFIYWALVKKGEGGSKEARFLSMIEIAVELSYFERKLDGDFLHWLERVLGYGR